MVLFPSSASSLKAQARCGFDVVHRRMLQSDPQYKRNVDETERWIKEYVERQPTPGVEGAQAALYTIPVVVHIIHTGGAQGTIYNPSDATIQAVINDLNKSYNGTGMSGVGDMEIQFALATRGSDCQGGSTGIVRYDASALTAYVNNGVNIDNSNGISDAQVKSLSRWDTRNYYNIWVVNKIDGANGTSGVFTAGYAYFPGSDYSIDGTIMLATQMYAGNKTLPHEIGHAFNLYHPFEGYVDPSTCPPNTDCATEGDKVCDTDPIVMPPDYSTCRTGTNPCTSSPYNSNTESNVMNYTNCFDVFTAGQKTRVLASAAGLFRTSLTQGYALSASYPLASFTAPVSMSLPATQSTGLALNATGIEKVTLNGTSFTSSYPADDNASSGSYDRSGSCHQLIRLTAGTNYSLTVKTLWTNNIQAKAWIDYNNNGAFDDATEAIGTRVNETALPTAGQAVFTFTVPATATFRRTLRLRVSQDVAVRYGTDALTDPTQQPKYGQVEDYPVYLTPPTITWTGAAGTGWNTAGNWSPAEVPAANYDIVIPDVANDPVLDQSRTYSNVTIQSGAVVTLGSFNLTVKGDLSHAGSVSGVGRLVFSGTTAQTISGIGTVSNLQIDNASGVTIAASSSRLSLTGTLTPSSGVLTTNGNLTLVSNASGTATVASGSGSYVSGNVTVERYIPAARRWRLLASPVLAYGSNSVFHNWQNNDAVSGSTGVEIWSPSGDANPGSGNSGMALRVGGQASIRKYVSGAWVHVTNTNTEKLFDASTIYPFAVFVTGPYGNGSGNIATGQSATTLSASGGLIMGTHVKSLGTAAASQYFLVGNPYASPIDPDRITLNNLSENLWVWDAKVGGNNNLGRYVSFNRTSNHYNILDAASGYPDNSVMIQSGQAFFVQASAAGAASLTFEEVHKSSSVSGLMFGIREQEIPFQSLRVTLQQDLNGEASDIDGAVALFREGSDPGIDRHDGAKMMNSSENLYLQRLGKDLTFEHRPPVQTRDTLFLMLGNLRPQAYRLRIHTQDFVGTDMLSVRLFDRLLGTTTTLNPGGTTVYAFIADPAASSDRFIITFLRPEAYAQDILIDARRQALEVRVHWSATNDLSVRQYVVERAVDSGGFKPIRTLRSANPGSGGYAIMDPSPRMGVNRYRVRAEHLDGSVKNSPVGIVDFEGTLSPLTVYPNPAHSRLRVFPGRDFSRSYDARILTMTGSIVWTGSAVPTDGPRLDIDISRLAPGAYQLELIDPSGVRRIARFLKE
jgi:hypothetical protein